MAGAFPIFHGTSNEDAREFLDSLEMAHLIAGRDQEDVKLRAFPLVLRGGARSWYDTLGDETRATWANLCAAFNRKYGHGDTPEGLWQQLLQLRQTSLADFPSYETKFRELWDRWAASLHNHGGAPNFLKKERYVAGLVTTLREKVEAKFPHTFEEAHEIATTKYRKLDYQVQRIREGRKEVEEVPHTLGETSRREPPNNQESQEDLLHKLTQQLESLNLNLVHAQREQPPRDGNRGQRRNAQELRCWNCNETGHGMYNCPHPRRIPGDMYPPRRPPQFVQQEVPRQPPPQATILQRPQQFASIPPVPQGSEERGVNIIQLEDFDQSSEEINIMPAIKRTRGQNREEDMQSEDTDGGKKDKKKQKDEVGESSKKKKRRPRRTITMEDFPLGKDLEPYDLLRDLQTQKPNISWPQLMHLSSKIRHQWPRVVSTRVPRKKEGKSLKSLSTRNPIDIEPIVEAYIKGRRISNVYIDGGAQMCVITERTMHKLGLEVTEPSNCHAKLANNSSVKCVGIIRGVKVTVCSIESHVDLYVMPTKGEGYPIILGRPWLMSVNADQKWGTGTLVLKKGKPVIYDMKQGRQADLDYESSVDEESSEDGAYTTTSYASSEEDESSIEVMGLIFKQEGDFTSKPLPHDVLPNEDNKLEDKIQGMLAKDLTKDEKLAFTTMLKKYPDLFPHRLQHDQRS